MFVSYQRLRSYGHRTMAFSLIGQTGDMFSIINMKAKFQLLKQLDQSNIYQLEMFYNPSHIIFVIYVQKNRFKGDSSHVFICKQEN